ncbi:hypothetical protein SAMN04487758_101145 [Enterococcus mundtii]|uniref:Uncharacterized protein n=1 Tax=Enterococcus mundtii TaxID=53346 RepID=A0A1I4J4Q8_ENTMU|nr:hypothetical protein A5802_001069 [Enterococcus mundtii]SFL61540.1 hypothetical protein SAMN04487758_101145 [Enterococcus mundtii]STD24083.1 Uncharacterised protein [Enterococcus mundtii]
MDYVISKKPVKQVNHTKYTRKEIEIYCVSNDIGYEDLMIG